MRVEIREVAWDDPISVALRAAQRDELTVRYNDANSEPGPAPTASDITLFLVAFDGDEGVGCGGLREIDEEHGEIKRMFVRPESRGTGISTLILRALEDAARERGWTRMVLETGDRQPEAIRLYEKAGYTRVPNFGHYVDSPQSICYSRTL